MSVFPKIRAYFQLLSLVFLVKPIIVLYLSLCYNIKKRDKGDEKNGNDITEQRQLNSKLAIWGKPEATQFIPPNPPKAWASMEIGTKDRLKVGFFKSLQIPQGPSRGQRFIL